MDKEELLKKKNEFWRSVRYYAGEVSVFIFSVMGIVLSDIIDNKVRGRHIHADDIPLDPVNIGIAVFLAVVTYGTMYSDFRYTPDKIKPPYVKRLSNAILQGLAWRSVISMTR